MICENCGSNKAHIVMDTIIYKKDKSIIEIEFPMIVCPDCKAEYITAETLGEIEKIKYQYQFEIKKKKLIVKMNLPQIVKN